MVGTSTKDVVGEGAAATVCCPSWVVEEGG